MFSFTGIVAMHDAEMHDAVFFKHTFHRHMDFV
jgi:hypothetical protein